DQHSRVTGILERTHPLKWHRPADVNVGGGHVDAELHAEGAAELQLRLEPAVRQDVDGVPGEDLDRGHGAPIVAMTLASPSPSARQPVRCRAIASSSRTS